MRYKIALRNLFRHRLRTFLSLLMIVGSVMAIIIFRGFSDYIVTSIYTISADSQFGHIQVASDLFWNSKGESRKKLLLSDGVKIQELLKAVPGVSQSSGRLSGYGLLSNGNYSIAVKAVGYDPTGEPKMTRYMRFPQGHGLKGPDETSILIGWGLQKKLGVLPGQDVTLVVSTMSGGVNAYDLNVAGIFSLGVEEIDTQLVLLPLNIAQKLFDTEKVDQLVVTTTDYTKAHKTSDQVNQLLSKNGFSALAKGWHDLADNAVKVGKFYDAQNFLIELILVSLMFLGIMNTVGMSVFERTGEIGTLRSLGVTRYHIVNQFLLEGLFLGVIGTVLGFLLGLLGAYSINKAQFLIEMPGASTPFVVQIHHVLSAYVIAALVCIITTLLASSWPALRASRIHIVEALRSNI